MAQGKLNKAVWLPEREHQMLSELAKKEDQSLSEWTRWIINKAYEAKFLSSKIPLDVNKLLEK